MSDQHKIEKLGEGEHIANYTLASSVGKDTDKHLYVRTRFDGVGNHFVRFVVSDHGTEKAYGKFDAAVEAYNAAP